MNALRGSLAKAGGAAVEDVQARAFGERRKRSPPLSQCAKVDVERPAGHLTQLHSSRPAHQQSGPRHSGAAAVHRNQVSGARLYGQFVRKGEFQVLVSSDEGEVDPLPVVIE